MFMALNANGERVSIENATQDYTGMNGSARKFAEEMISRGIVDKIRAEEGN